MSYKMSSQLQQDYVNDRLDSTEVYDEDGELDGFVLIEKAYPDRHLSPVRCCRTCAWAEAVHIQHVPGIGLRYRKAGV